MIFLRTFLNSIKLPNKQAMFKLNRVGMDITVVYMFILLLIVSIPSITNQLTTGAGAQMNLLFFLIYFLIFNYLPLTMIVFLFLTLMAYIGTGITKLLRRKVRFPMLWKLTAYITTIPFLLYTALAFFFAIGDVFAALFSLYTFLFLIKLITIYPKRKKRKQEFY
ncbi:hypothetical protein [Lentibacillus salinarum]|uniref:hypothetical protein n=1 Tax=Lentibacillus salinarum TaxID=446820 RepID=UPI0036D32735